MKITSPAFADRLPVPEKYTCKGANVSPPLEFLDVPKAAESLVVLVQDVDSKIPTTHWLVYNIPASAAYFEEGKLPQGAIEGLSMAGVPGYHGPCPKLFTGIHHFAYRLFALDCFIDESPSADYDVIQRSMERHILDSAELVALSKGEQIS